MIHVDCPALTYTFQFKQIFYALCCQVSIGSSNDGEGHPQITPWINPETLLHQSAKNISDLSNVLPTAELKSSLTEPLFPYPLKQTLSRKKVDQGKKHNNI